MVDHPFSPMLTLCTLQLVERLEDIFLALRPHFFKGANYRTTSRERNGVDATQSPVLGGELRSFLPLLCECSSENITAQG
jgi:hypothetical protein